MFCARNTLSFLFYLVVVAKYMINISASDTQTVILIEIVGRVLNTRSFQYVDMRFLPNSGKIWLLF